MEIIRNLTDKELLILLVLLESMIEESKIGNTECKYEKKPKQNSGKIVCYNNKNQEIIFSIDEFELENIDINSCAIVLEPGEFFFNFLTNNKIFLNKEIDKKYFNSKPKKSISILCQSVAGKSWIIVTNGKNTRKAHSVNF